MVILIQYLMDMALYNPSLTSTSIKENFTTVEYRVMEKWYQLKDYSNLMESSIASQNPALVFSKSTIPTMIHTPTLSH